MPAQREIREEAERHQLHLLRGNVDLSISANRDPRFLERGGLPADQRSSRVPAGAFIGAVPYRRAKELNVKLVVEWHIPSTKISTRWRSSDGDVVRVDHRHSVDDATRLSADVERAVRLRRRGG